MKDQNSVDSETKQEKWNRGKTLFLESVHKPDHQLRSCAHNQKCYHELMEIRDLVIGLVNEIPNPHQPNLKFGEKNDTITPTTNGISDVLLSGALGDYYRSKMEDND